MRVNNLKIVLRCELISLLNYKGIGSVTSFISHCRSNDYRVMLAGRINIHPQMENNVEKPSTNTIRSLACPQSGQIRTKNSITIVFVVRNSIQNL
ncbi:hypothetical protein HMPREF9545_00302 [Escherichia coli MS 16-3]|nr:hypothetical protein HMPREF9545_00302 [Escherichia coli MS 16-3]